MSRPAGREWACGSRWIPSISERRRRPRSEPAEYDYYSHIKIASVSEAKSSLSALLDRVRAGESVLIVDRGRPIARLEPLRAFDDGDARISTLERQ
ncbi:MAG: type II toxin-antitoxin system Phd/YefM family antitoxin, partial [Acidimicrobiales bacterium]